MCASVGQPRLTWSSPMGMRGSSQRWRHSLGPLPGNAVWCINNATWWMLLRIVSAKRWVPNFQESSNRRRKKMHFSIWQRSKPNIRSAIPKPFAASAKTRSIFWPITTFHRWCIVIFAPPMRLKVFASNVRQRTDQIDTFTTETSCLTIVWAVMQDIHLPRIPIG